MLDIARYYPPDVLEEVADFFNPEGCTSVSHDRDGYCPLGYANHLLKERYPDLFRCYEPSKMPTGGYSAAESLDRLAGGTHPNADEARNAASAFITRWDNAPDWGEFRLSLHDAFAVDESPDEYVW